MRKYRILYEDSDLFVLYKPPGLAVQSAKASVPDVMSMLGNELRERGEAGSRLFPVNRLDQPVEGIFLVARNEKAAANLSGQVQDHLRMEKCYQALVYGKPSWEECAFMDYLVKDGRANVSRVVPEGTAGAKRAELCCRVIRKWEECALLEIRLLTGRHHQIRVQLAHAGFPIKGDSKYGKAVAERGQLALCCVRTAFFHPRTEELMNFQVEPTFPVPPTVPG